MGESDSAGLAWKRRFERERAARKHAESLLEQKSSELYSKNQELELKTRELNLVASEKQHALDLALDTLERDTQKLHALSNSVPGVLCQFRQDDSGEIRFDFLSKRSGEIFGFKVDDVLADWRAIGIHPDDIEPFKEAIKQASENEGDWFFEGRILDPDENTFWWRGAGNSELKNGRVVFSGILLDITQLREAQERLEEENERSKALAIQAEASTRAKSRFIANMSHEMRTPLNSVLGYAQLLKLDDDLPVEVLEQIGVILDSGEHLMALINDILEISKIEAGKVSFNRVSFSLADLLNGIVAVFYVEAERKSIRVSWEFGSEQSAQMISDQVVSDPRILRQILVNLVGNAVKFTERGSVRILVDFVKRNNRGVKIRFAVRDTGMGIPEEMQKVIFEEFEQLSTNKQGTGGTGLGLSISGHLIKLMGGEIGLKSKPTEGSEFSFEIYIQETVREEPIADVSPGVGQYTGYAGKRRKVLVVDDSKTTRGVIKALLNRIDVDVFQAENGVAALEVLNEVETDAVISDINMPEMDGRTLCREIRKSARFMNMPILAFTGSVMKDTEQQVLNDGFNALLFKPVVATQLFQVLGDILNLEWIHTSTPERKIPEQKKPDSRIIEQFKEFVSVGDFASILALASSDELKTHYAEFSSEITKRAKAFDFDGLDEYLERNA